MSAAQDNVETRINPNTGETMAYVKYTVTFTNKSDVTTTMPGYTTLHPRIPSGLRLSGVNVEGGPWWLENWVGPETDGTIPLNTGMDITAHDTQTITFTNVFVIDTDSVTYQGWEALSTCDPTDPSKGLTTQVDVTKSSGFDAGSFTTCTAVTRPQG